MESILLKRTIKLLKERRGEYREIADRSGRSYSWLRKLATHQLNNPCINEVEELFKLLYTDKHQQKPTAINLHAMN